MRDVDDTVCKIRCGGYHLVRDVDDTLSVR